MGCWGNSRRRAFTAWRPSPRMRGVPASSQSTPARAAVSATGIASSMVIRSRETWTIGSITILLPRRTPGASFLGERHVLVGFGDRAGAALRDLDPEVVRPRAAAGGIDSSVDDLRMFRAVDVPFRDPLADTVRVDQKDHVVEIAPY